MLRDQEGNTIKMKGTPMASNNHRLILGKSGYGKTWCCYRMVEEAVEQNKKCVIFDYSGSYTAEEQERSKELIFADSKTKSENSGVTEKTR